jgi:exosome complex RNA-binding protein Rrp4
MAGQGYERGKRKWGFIIAASAECTWIRSSHAKNGIRTFFRNVEILNCPTAQKNEDQNLTCSCWRNFKLVRPERGLICEISFSFRSSVSPSSKQYFDCSLTAKLHHNYTCPTSVLFIFS